MLNTSNFWESSLINIQLTCTTQGFREVVENRDRELRKANLRRESRIIKVENRETIQDFFQKFSYLQLCGFAPPHVTRPHNIRYMVSVMAAIYKISEWLMKMRVSAQRWL